MAKKRKSSALREFLESAEDGLEESAKRGEVIATMSISSPDTRCIRTFLSSILKLILKR